MCGVGGHTIAEVKNNLTRSEIFQWSEYRSKRGSLNQGRRTEQAIGYLISYYFNSKLDKNDKKYLPIEFMPNEDHQDEPPSPEQTRKFVFR